MDSVLEDNLRSVSYTHLDVYKRQLLQTKDYKSYLPEEKQEEFEAIAFSVFNCLESFLMMLEYNELHYQPKPIEEESDLDN